MYNKIKIKKSHSLQITRIEVGCIFFFFSDLIKTLSPPMHWPQLTLLITPKGLYIKIPHLSQQTNTKFSTFGTRAIHWLRMLSCQLTGSREPHTHTHPSCQKQAAHGCPKSATCVQNFKAFRAGYFWQLLPLITLSPWHATSGGFSPWLFQCAFPFDALSLSFI